MAKRTYHFTCKKCGHEYLHDNDYIWKCPKCGTINQTDGKI